MNFQTPSEDGYGTGSNLPDLASFLEHNAPASLRTLTAGSFSYSSTRPTANKKYFYDIFDTCAQVNCHVEGWHTEGGPGVYEAVCIHLPAEPLSNLPGPQSMRDQRDGRPCRHIQVCPHSKRLLHSAKGLDCSPNPSESTTASHLVSWLSQDKAWPVALDTSTFPLPIVTARTCLRVS